MLNRIVKLWLLVGGHQKRKRFFSSLISFEKIVSTARVFISACVGRVSLGENTNKLGGTVIVAGECFELNKISLTALKLKVTRFQTLSPCSPSLVRLSRINLTCHNLIYRPHHHKSVAVINTTAEIFTRTSPPPPAGPVQDHQFVRRVRRKRRGSRS